MSSEQNNTSSFKQFLHSRFFAALVIFIILVVTGFIAYSRLFRDKAPLVDIFPAQPFFYVSFNSDRNVEQYQFSQKYPTVVSALSATLETFGAAAAGNIDASLNYHDDLYPWLGTEMAVAAYRRDQAKPDAGLYFYVIAEIGDRTQYQVFKDKLGTLGYTQTNLAGERSALYKDGGVLLFEQKGFLIATASVADANYVLDNQIQGNAVLKDDPLYKEIRNNLPNKFDFVCLLDSVTTLKQLTKNYLSAELIDSLKPDKEMLGLFGVAVSFTQQGLKINAFFPGFGKNSFTEKGNWDFTALVPADTYFVFAGRNLQNILTGLLGQPQTIERLQNNYKLQQNLGVDLEQELLPHLTAEYALVNFPIPLEEESGTVLLAQVPNQAALRTSLEKISRKSLAALSIELQPEEALNKIAISQEFFGQLPYYVRWEQDFVIASLRLKDIVAYEEIIAGEASEVIGNADVYRDLNATINFRSGQHVIYYNPHFALSELEIIDTFLNPGSIASIIGSAEGLGITSRKKNTGFAWEGIWLLK